MGLEKRKEWVVGGLGSQGGGVTQWWGALGLILE